MWGGSQTTHASRNPYRCILQVYELHRREAAYFSDMQWIFQICTIRTP